VDEAQFLSPVMLAEIRGLLNYECDAFAPQSTMLASGMPPRQRHVLSSQ